MQRERELETSGQSLQLVQSPDGALSEADQQTRLSGSYGRGIYAGHSTFGLDYCYQGGYGRGIYAGHSTFDRDFDTPGSYGRGVYAGHITFGLDFRRNDSYARGMEQAHIEP